MKINENYKSLETSYLFSTIAKKLGEYTAQNPEAKVIKMGIGDVTLPLAEKVISEMHKAVDEMGSGKTFRGYGPEQGYDFLKDEIKNYYEKNGVTLDAKEIFISDGAKSDIGNILNLFSKDNVVLVPDPVYPVYVDTNIMDGRTIKFLNANAENGFLPLPDDSIKADLIYICSPNNPTGACYSHTDLTKWVRYAKEQNAVILFDAA
ncbi:MAG: aminotransferase class I/II-fold pyridoxal phosphate-dependent enzyme, partial [Oscillospiraceae bacterium]